MGRIRIIRRVTIRLVLVLLGVILPAAQIFAEEAAKEGGKGNPLLALAAMGETEKAHIVFNWLSEHVFDDGSFWCGFTFPDMTRWPEEKITWTNAVVLMAADALFSLTPGGQLFSHTWWAETGYMV